MIVALALLAATVAGQTAADAERAFAAQVQQDQRAAFRATADPHAIMYAPDLVFARDYLGHLAPPAAVLSWQPAHTITSCDGTLAYSTGPWTRSDGKTGTFGTVWHQDASGWHWLYEGGHDGTSFAGAATTVIEDRASCSGLLGSVSQPSDDSLPETAARKQGGEFGGVGWNGPMPVAILTRQARAGLVEASDGPMPLSLRIGAVVLSSMSNDRTLVWRINAIMAGRLGAHLLRVWAWDGRRYRLAVFDVTGARQ